MKRFQFDRVMWVVWMGVVVCMTTRPARAVFYTVTGTVDNTDSVTHGGSGAQATPFQMSSLRGAILAANATVGVADTITLPAGTYTLTIANTGGVNEDACQKGDLDVTDSLTINGAGAATTIVQAGTTTANGIDKVLAINPFCDHVVNFTMSGVTVRFGRNTQPSGAADFSFTGGGIDWCAFGAGSVFTLSDSIVSDNTNVNGYGGGLNVDTSGLGVTTTVNITNDTFQNNQTLSPTNTATGGAINLFGAQPTINITNSTFSGNHTTNPTSGGGAIYFRPTAVSSLFITGSTFTSNTAPGIGGAIATDTHGAGTTITIQNSTFTGNSATNSFGGALKLDSTDLNSTPFSLTHLKITGNTAGASGGGIYVGHSNVTMSKSLIVGNNAPTGKGLQKSVDAATATVTNNWWGASTGPGAAPGDTATTAGGTLTFTPWYRDQLTASISPIVTNQSVSLTASFLTNSANTAVPVADVAEIIGRSVTWATTLGNLSSTQGTVQAAGTATGSFQATATGTAILSAKVDNDNTSPASSNVLSLTVNKASTTTGITSDTPDPSGTGQSVTVNFHVTSSTGSTPTAPTGNVTVSDGTSNCTGSINSSGDGSCNVTLTSAGSKTLTASYAGDTNFLASTSAGASHTVTTSITQWRSVRTHAGTPQSIVLNAAATGNGLTGPTVESRDAGIQTIQVDFDSPISLTATPSSGVTVSDGTTSYPPSSVIAVDADTIALNFNPGVLPDQKCYTITIGSGTITQTISGDNNVMVRALAGDATGSGEITLSDAVATKARAGQAVASNARFDMNLDGAITVAGDALYAKARVFSPSRKALCP